MKISAGDLQKAIAHLEANDWQAAHDIVQRDEDSLLTRWAHGIVHLMEGDDANARYWFGQAGRPFPQRNSLAAEIRALKLAAAARE
jgi:hypothetical protein